jgi:CRP-like cAMP-binding protein
MNTNAHAALRAMPALSKLALPECTALCLGAREIRVAAGQAVMRKGDPADAIMVLLQGRLRVSAVSVDGRAITFRLVEPVEMVGEIGVLDGRPRTADVAAVVASRLLVLRRESCVDAIAAHPAIAQAMLQLMCMRLRETSDGLERVATQRLPARIAQLLLRLAAEYGRPTPGGGVKLPMRLSQSEIGTLVAATREAVNKQLRLWRDDGLLTIESGHVVLLRPALLADIFE